jgi:hypothetical protein
MKKIPTIYPMTILYLMKKIKTKQIYLAKLINASVKIILSII